MLGKLASALVAIPNITALDWVLGDATALIARGGGFCDSGDTAGRVANEAVLNGPDFPTCAAALYGVVFLGLGDAIAERTDDTGATGAPGAAGGPGAAGAAGGPGAASVAGGLGGPPTPKRADMVTKMEENN